MKPILNRSILLILPLLMLSSMVNAETWPPKVPFSYALGMSQYVELCSSCHGEWGDGTDQGPPLLHVFYKRSHHSNASFHRAIMNGVKAHHWNFGDMPPVAGATEGDVKSIVSFVRWLQNEKGIK